MNQDQAISLAASILKIVGAALTAHGATKAAALINSEDVIGVITTVAGLVWSHFYNAAPKSTVITNPIAKTPPAP